MVYSQKKIWDRVSFRAFSSQQEWCPFAHQCKTALYKIYAELAMVDKPILCCSCCRQIFHEMQVEHIFKLTSLYPQQRGFERGKYRYVLVAPTCIEKVLVKLQHLNQPQLKALFDQVHGNQHTEDDHKNALQELGLLNAMGNIVSSGVAMIIQLTLTYDGSGTVNLLKFDEFLAHAQVTKLNFERLQARN